MQNKAPEERRAIAAKGLATKRANKAAVEAARAKALARRDELLSEICELERRLRAMTDHCATSELSFKLTSQYLLAGDEIVARGVKVERCSGVYFLISEGRVVYVGQARNVFARVSAHTDKKFDAFAYVPCPIYHLNRLESLYIHTLKPRLNGSDPRGGKCAPLSLADLLRMAGPFDAADPAAGG